MNGRVKNVLIYLPLMLASIFACHSMGLGLETIPDGRFLAVMVLSWYAVLLWELRRAAPAAKGVRVDDFTSEF